MYLSNDDYLDEIFEDAYLTEQYGSDTKSMQKMLSFLLHIPLEIDGITGKKTNLAKSTFSKYVDSISNLPWIYQQNAGALRGSFDHFDHDSHIIKPEHQKELCAFVRKLVTNTRDGYHDDKLLIIGHADPSGYKSHNNTLSKKRAYEMKRHFDSMLGCQRIGYGHFSTAVIALGEEFPLTTRPGVRHGPSRRVDFISLRINK